MPHGLAKQIRLCLEMSVNRKYANIKKKNFFKDHLSGPLCSVTHLPAISPDCSLFLLLLNNYIMLMGHNIV